MEWVASTLTPPLNVVYPTLLKLMCTPRLPAVDWTDAPTNLNGLVRFGERRNLVSAHVPSRSARAILNFSTKMLVLEMWKIQDLILIFSGWGCWSGTERSKLDNIPCGAAVDTAGRPRQSAREATPYLGTDLHVSWPYNSVKCWVYLERSFANGRFVTLKLLYVS